MKFISNFHNVQDNVCSFRHSGFFSNGPSARPIPRTQLMAFNTDATTAFTKTSSNGSVFF